MWIVGGASAPSGGSHPEAGSRRKRGRLGIIFTAGIVLAGILSSIPGAPGGVPNPSGMSFRGAAGDGESGTTLISRTRFLAALGITGLGAIFQQPARAAAQTQASPPATPAQSARPSIIDPKAKPILDQCLAALGGPAFLSFRTLTTRGRMFTISAEITTGLAPFQNWMQYPDKRRISYGKSKPVIAVFFDNEGWEIDNYGVMALSVEEVRRWALSNRYSLENLLRLRINEPGILIQPAGVDFIENMAVTLLDVIDARQTHIRLYLDKKSYLPARISYRLANPKTGDQDEYADGYSDYQTFDGVSTPMHITRFVNDERVSEIFRNTAQYNQEYPPSYFEQPK